MHIIARELPFSAVPEQLRPLYAYWQGKCGVHRMPARADIDPLDLRSILGWISLIEIRPTPPKFFVRVAASNLNNPFGTQNGSDLSVIRSAAYRAALERHWTLVAETGEPRFDEFTLEFQGYKLVYCRLALPLGADHSTPDMILLGSHFDNPVSQKLFLEVFDRAVEKHDARFS